MCGSFSQSASSAACASAQILLPPSKLQKLLSFLPSPMTNSLLLLLLLTVFEYALSSSSEPHFLLLCGSNSSLHLPDGRSFFPDCSSSPNITISPSSSNFPLSSSSSTSARVFTKSTSYTFHLHQSHHPFLLLLRLHFLPHFLHSALFTVSANGHTLFSLRNPSHLLQEYFLVPSTAAKNDAVVLRFIPAIGFIAYVHAIEVITVTERLFDSRTVPPGAALETCYRIDMGGSARLLANDSLWRQWKSDGQFLVNPNSARSVMAADAESLRYGWNAGPEIAPRWVYATAREMADANVSNQHFNISWSFDVDPGFDYLVRLHFCDVVSTVLGGLLFNVYINHKCMLNDFDISLKAGGLSTAYYVDFVVKVEESWRRILVQIGPPVGSTDAMPNAILNGLEIMKFSDAHGSLDASHNTADVDGESDTSKRKRVVALITALCLGGAVACGLLFSMVFLLFRYRKPQCRNKCRMATLAWLLPANQLGSPETKLSVVSVASSRPMSALGRVFGFLEIQEVTKNFDESLVLGIGGFGKVYKGVLENGIMIAVKRGNPQSRQGLVEFRTEIGMLSKLRHRHLVSLIGYCQERNEMILVYEYMAGGSLRRHLYGSDLPPLSWMQRLEICIGAAKGLHYLHTGAAETIIHRDVKTTNILLDENLTAKVADFGLSKLCPSIDQTHVSTVVKGSFGYLDPEYYRRQRLTEKSDVYSFGVVLLEVLCARPAINPALPRDQVNIAEWAMYWQKKGQLKHVIDPHLRGTVSLDSLRKLGETAEKCLAEHGIERPSMGDVLWNLEYALQLQETFSAMQVDENCTTGIEDIPDSIPQMELARASSYVTHCAPEMADTSEVFSQLMDPKGR